jgi:ribonucleoside-diphosphate reductase alpha chain
MTRYNETEVKQSTLKYFNENTLAADVTIKKYLLRDNKGNLCELNPADMFERITSELYRIDCKYPNPLSRIEFLCSIDDFKYIVLGGSNMNGIGNDFQLTSLSNCFVIDSPKDSIGGITYTEQEQMQLMKRRGGVGFALDNIRTKGSPVNNAAGSSTGITNEMERYSNATKYIAQDGRRKQ